MCVLNHDGLSCICSLSELPYVDVGLHGAHVQHLAVCLKNPFVLLLACYRNSLIAWVLYSFLIVQFTCYWLQYVLL